MSGLVVHFFIGPHFVSNQNDFLDKRNTYQFQQEARVRISL